MKSNHGDRRPALIAEEQSPPRPPREPVLPETGDAPVLLPAGLIERALGTAPGSWGADDLLSFARHRGIRLVSLMHVGGDGWLKTLDFVPRDEAHLRAILTGGERADGSSLFPGIRADASDVVLRPRLETAFVDPFAPHPTLALLCGHLGADGEPLAASPDTIIRRAHARLLEETGVNLWALGEIEFFLGQRLFMEREFEGKDHGYHATSPFVFGEELRRRALVLLGEMGVPVKYGHSEVGAVPANETDRTEWEQHEVELALAPLPQAADAITLTAWVLRNLARRHGCGISFSPMLREGHPGNGLHFHLSPCLRGRHLEILDERGRPGEAAGWLVGGLARMGGALMAFGNRYPESFARLSQGREAPRVVSWGQRDRQALIRIPIVPRDVDGRPVAPPTVEFRLPDGSAIQHLMLAGIAQAMLLGRATPDLPALLERTSAARVRETGEGAAAVARSRGEIRQALRTHRAEFEAGGVFPAEVIDQTLAALG